MIWLYIIFYLTAIFLVNYLIIFFDDIDGFKSLTISATVIISLFSLLYFLSLVTHLPYLGLIIFLILFLTYSIYHLKKSTKKSFKFTFNYRDFAYFNTIMILGFWSYKKAFSLDGKWDAWAFWNTHAKFLASGNWKELFNQSIDHVHADYPLLLPANIAGFWHFTKTDTAMVPILFSFVIFYLLLFGLYSFISNRLIGLAIISYLVFNAVFYNEALSQYADTLVALYYFISVAAFYYLKNKNDRLMFITGFLAFSNMWIKNEGIAFAMVFFIFSMLFYFRKHKQQGKYFILGGLLPIFITLIFKIGYAPDNDLTSKMSDNVLQLFDFKRFTTIINFLRQTIYDFYPAILILMVLHLYQSGLKFRYKTGLAVLSSIFVVYILIYMLTPNDLNWHLATSAIRLIHQLFPLFLYLMINELIYPNSLDDKLPNGL